jgi:hypothetical protein
MTLGASLRTYTPYVIGVWLALLTAIRDSQGASPSRLADSLSGCHNRGL